LWQPIPIETVEILDHQSFGMFDHCPEGVKNLKEGEGYKRLEGLFKEEIEKMEKDTQMKIDGIFILQRVLDSIVTRVYFLLKEVHVTLKTFNFKGISLSLG